MPKDPRAAAALLAAHAAGPYLGRAAPVTKVVGGVSTGQEVVGPVATEVSVARASGVQAPAQFVAVRVESVARNAVASGSAVADERPMPHPAKRPPPPPPAKALQQASVAQAADAGFARAEPEVAAAAKLSVPAFLECLKPSARGGIAAFASQHATSPAGAGVPRQSGGERRCERRPFQGPVAGPLPAEALAEAQRQALAFVRGELEAWRQDENVLRVIAEGYGHGIGQRRVPEAAARAAEAACSGDATSAVRTAWDERSSRGWSRGWGWQSQ